MTCRKHSRRARGGRGAFHRSRALATFFGRLAPDFRSQLAAFRLRCQAQHPDAQSFAALTHEQQIAFLTQVERTPFFERVRLLTRCSACLHVCAAEIRRQSQPRRLEAHRLPGPAHILAALRLLRPGLPRLQHPGRRMTRTYRLCEPVDFEIRRRSTTIAPRAASATSYGRRCTTREPSAAAARTTPRT